MSQKGYKDLTLAKFINGYIFVYLEHSEEISQQHYFTHLRDLMRLSVFYKWDSVHKFQAAMLNRIESSRARWGDDFTEEQKCNVFESDHLPTVNKVSSPPKRFPNSQPRKVYCNDWNCSGDCSFSSDPNHVSSQHICAYCKKPGHRIESCFNRPAVKQQTHD